MTESPVLRDKQRRHPWRAICIWAGVALMAVAGMSLWRPWVTAKADWLREAAREVKEYGPPPTSVLEAAARDEWAGEKYLVFSNGWAAFKMHRVHDPGTVSDAAVLWTSEGELFQSRKHLSRGIPGWKLEHARPASITDYLATYGREQGWKRSKPARTPSADYRQ